jgi:hypothetical protein
MAAVAGILFTDAVGLPKWYEAGALEYGIPPLAQLAILAPVMGFLETKRLEGFLATGQSGFVSTFPFDPMGQNAPDKATKEVKNGRLAMVRLRDARVCGCAAALCGARARVERLLRVRCSAARSALRASSWLCTHLSRKCARSNPLSVLPPRRLPSLASQCRRW